MTDTDTTIRCMNIATDGDTTLVRYPTDPELLEALQNFVGGWIEAVNLIAGLTMWVNEDGKLVPLPYNHVATMIGWRYGLNPYEAIFGNAVLTGGPDGVRTMRGLDGDLYLELVELVSEITGSSPTGGSG